MGELNHFDLGEYKGIDTFVETGTLMGKGLAYAAKSNFKKLYSIEIDDSWAKKARVRFKNDKRIKIIQGRSDKALQKLLPKIKGRVLFWLDAHFPGEFGAGDSFDAEPDGNIRLPLEQELQSIAELRKGRKDIILIDDLRIYEDGPFDRGDWEKRSQFGQNSCDFVKELFAKTHKIEKDFSDAGYLILTPNGRSKKSIVKSDKLRIAHFSQYAPNLSGLYESVHDLILAERECGAQAELIDVGPLNETKKLYGSDEIKAFPFEYADKADILCWHRAIPDKWLNTPSANLVLFLHGTPEFCFTDELMGRDRSYSLVVGASKTHGPTWPGVKYFVTMWKRHVPYWENVFEDPGRIILTNPWVDLKRFKLKRDTFKNGRLRLGLIDQWRLTREPFAILHAVQRAVRIAKKKGLKITLDVWGQGKTIPRPYLVQCQHLLADGTMRIHGIARHPEKNIYPKIDVILSTNPDETRVVREGLASGTPVICARRGATFPCWQEDGFDLERLTNLIFEAYSTLSNQNRRKKLRHELRGFAEREFDSAIAGSKLVELFERLKEVRVAS